MTTINLTELERLANYAIDSAQVRTTWSGDMVTVPDKISLDPQTVLALIRCAKAAKDAADYNTQHYIDILRDAVRDFEL